jgi:hypothetical protein
MRLSLLISGNANEAVKAADVTAASIDKVTKASATATAATQAESAALSAKWTQAAGAAAASSQAVRLNTFQMQNMAFQMNDMATMLASGQSPFVMLMQQGMQISQIFSPGTGVVAALKGVGTALISFVTNPLNLAVLGFAATAGAASLFFRTVFSGSNSTEASLERHRALIEDIRKKWGDAGRAATAYGQEAEQALSLQRQTQIDVQEQTAAYQRALQGIRIEITTMTELGPNMGTQIGQAFGKLTPLAVEFGRQIKAGNPDLEAFRKELDGIATDPNVEPGIRRKADELRQLTTAAANAAIRLKEAHGAASLFAGTTVPKSPGLTNAFDVGFGETESAMKSLRDQLIALQPPATITTPLKNAFAGILDIRPQLAGVAEDLGGINDLFGTLKESGQALFRGIGSALMRSGDLWRTLGERAIDALGRIEDKLLDSAFNNALNALLGAFIPSGGVATIAGGVGSPATGCAWGGLNAAGGYQRGPGTGTSDSIVARVSNGEFIVNAAATARHRPLLEAVNSNRPLPRFAAGGFVGARTSGSDGAAAVRIEILNQAPGVQVRDGGRRNEGGTNVQQLIISAAADDIQRDGPLSKAIAGTFSLQRKTRR